MVNPRLAPEVRFREYRTNEIAEYIPSVRILQNILFHMSFLTEAKRPKTAERERRLLWVFGEAAPVEWSGVRYSPCKSC